MANNSNFDAGAAFDESLQKRIAGYERKAERAKKAWQGAKTGSKIAGSTDFIDIPEFKLQRKFDEETGRVSYEIGQSTRRIKTPHLEGIRRLKKRAYYEAKGYVHQKISENEQDNTGVEAAHKIEEMGEEASANLKRMLPSGRSVSRKLQQELERRAQKAEKEYHYSLFQKEIAEQSAKANLKTFVADKGTESGINVGKKTSSFASKKAAKSAEKASRELSKEEAKRRARKMFKRSMRQAQIEAAKKTAQIGAAKAAEGAADATAVAGTTGGAVAGGTATGASMATGVGEYVLLAIAIIICVIVIILVAIMIVFVAYTQMQYQSGVLGAMYQSDPMEIENAELHYSYMEASLRAYIEEIETREEGYDGYVYDSVDSIGHNPYTLINYLSAKYGEFTFNDVKPEIEDLFSESYELTTWIEDIEVEQPPPEEDSEEDEDEDEEEDEEEEEEEEPQTITLHILHVKLIRKPLEDIVSGKMSEEEIESYNLYGESHGGFQFIKSPTDGDFYSQISSLYGYRYHPIYEEIRLHRGLDIALPEGTSLYAGIDGVVTVGNDPSGYGNFVTITGTDGTEVRYAHMSVISVTNGAMIKKGDIIGESGNTGASTGPHVHVEVKQNGEYYNPLFYLDTE